MSIANLFLKCIVQSYVQWLQDSDYNPICILCKNLLKDEPTVRLICYDVFHWSCIDKYCSELPSDTAPAGYQCPKCKECIFPPPNLVSPVVDELKKKLETVSWSRVGLGQSLLQIGEELSAIASSNELPPASSTNAAATHNTDDESNGFVIVSQKDKAKHKTNEFQSLKENESAKTSNLENNSIKLANKGVNEGAPSSKPQQKPANKKSDNEQLTKYDQSRKFEAHDLDSITPISHNRVTGVVQSNQEQSYDSSLGIVLNIDNLDRDTGDNKYKRRPILEWFSRFLRSRQLAYKKPLFRMTRQKKILFIVLVLLITLFTLIIIFSRLGNLSTEDDPALDPMNNPNIRVQ